MGAAPSPLSQGSVELSLAGQKAEPAQVVAAGQTCSAHLAWGRAGWQLCGGISLRGEEPVSHPEQDPRLWLPG